MINFKTFITEKIKETDWTNNLSEKQFVEHLKQNKASAVMTGLAKHPMFRDYHFGGTRGSGDRIYKHKSDEFGHQVKTINTNNPTEYLHAFVSPRGKVYSVNHNKIDTNPDGTTTISTKKSFSLKWNKGMNMHYIIGKACEDYNTLLDNLKLNPIKNLKLNDEAFSNWKLNKYPEKITRKVYNNGILELVDGV